jgi:hypothetical protein
VARNEIDDEGVIGLARSQTMKSLVRLGLGGNPEISDAGCSALLKSPHLKGLLKCELDGLYLSDELSQKLAKRWGHAATNDGD